MRRERGCGFRVEGGLYACVESSPYGMPIEWFLTDPVRPWHGEFSRGPILMQDPRPDHEEYHMVLWIGATHYPFASDFVEEVRVMGVSKRVRANYDFSKLDPELSGLILVHPRAVPEFDYYVEADCPKKRWFPDLHKDGSDCIGDLWGLSSTYSVDKVHDLMFNDYNTVVTVHTPSTTYYVPKVYKEDRSLMTLSHIKDYFPGSILFFPKFHFEYINKEGMAPEELAQPLIAEGWEFRVMDE